MAETVNEATATAASHWSGSPAAKIGGVLGLFVLMLVPQMLTGNLIEEREGRQAEVLATFRTGWGPEQVVSGPALLVPYTYQRSEGSADRAIGMLRLPASRLDVTATLDPQRRRRGLFQATIYSATVEMSGVITPPPMPNLVGNPQFEWAAARVVIGASDLRGMQPDQTLEWGNMPITLEPDGSQECRSGSLAVPAGLSGPPASFKDISFKVAMTLRGTQAFRIAPSAGRTTMRVTSVWPSPAAVGASLPVDYRTDASGFDAKWDIAGDPSQVGWRPQSGCLGANTDTATAPGVELQEAVPTYALVDRTAKYGLFFLALAYLTLFLFETLSRVRIHLVQYGLVGLSVSLFALLLISIAEPLGFVAAYAITSAAVILQASLYTYSAVGRAGLARIFAAVLGALFAFIYVVLSLDTYALLAGTVALFAILSVLMAVTRRVNWGAAQPVS